MLIIRILKSQVRIIVKNLKNNKPGYFIFFRIWFIAELLFMDHFHNF